MQTSDALIRQKPQRTVLFEGIDRSVALREGETLLEGARRAGVRLVASCGGGGVCGSCAVRIVSGEVEPRDGCAVGEDGWVCACRLRPLTDCVVEISPRALAAAVRTDAEAQLDDPPLPLSPVVAAFEVRTAPFAETETGGDLERYLDALGKERVSRYDLEALRQLSPLLHAHEGRLRAVVRAGELLGALPPGKRLLGLALDLGTTNVAGYLVDLESGERLAGLGAENPQAVRGADLVNRVNHAVKTDGGGRELQKAAIGALTTLAEELCRSVEAGPNQIAEIALCGNTAMQHLLLGLPVSRLGRAPFIPAACAAIDVKARDLGLSALPGAWVHVLPGIGGFVGGDHVAALLSTERFWKKGTSLLVDVGTNTEISLIHGDSILTASTASGPALEGGNISSGMRAARGAIERVRFSCGALRTEVIGGGEAVGICGSGVVDALAALREAEIVDRRGSLRPGHPAVRETGGRRECLLAPQVPFTQADVRAVQLAKAAIRAGVDLLLGEASLEETEIGRVVIAGAFGMYLDVESCIGIGMFPGLPRERFFQVGNAAGAGVRMALTSREARQRARELAARCRHVELGSRPDFQKVFMQRIGL